MTFGLAYSAAQERCRNNKPRTSTGLEAAITTSSASISLTVAKSTEKGGSPEIKNRRFAVLDLLFGDEWFRII